MRFQGESLSADTSAVEPIRQKLLKLIEDQQLTLNQVFNADETGLYWHLLPEKTLAGSYEKTAKNFKKPKDKVSILATANASGDFRLPLLLIGKSKNPRALKNINLSALPVNYKHQKKAWMDSVIFKSWFFDHFIPSVTSYLRGKGYARKAVLVLDNAPSHPQLDILQSPDGAFTCFFLPPNTTSIIQPMDQGVLENLKRRCKRPLLQKLLLSLDDGRPQQFVKGLNIKDCIYMCAKAWDDIREESLSRAWTKLLVGTDPSNIATDSPGTSGDADDASSILIVGTELNLSSSDVYEWLDTDHNLGEDLTDEEIVQLVQAPESNHGESSDEESEEPSVCSLVSHKEAVEAFDVTIRYLEQQPSMNSVQLMLLIKLRSSAMTECLKSMKQTNIKIIFIHIQYQYVS